MGGREGDEPKPLSATVDAMERMHDYEDLIARCVATTPCATVDDVDEEASSGSWASRPFRDLRRLKEVDACWRRPV